MKKKDIVVKWIVNDDALPVLYYSIQSLQTAFAARTDLLVKYWVFYNGQRLDEFKECLAKKINGVDVVDQKSMDLSTYPIPVKRCIWKQFPNIRVCLEAHEIYLDCDVVFVRPKELFEWIDSPMKSILIYKNDHDTAGYNNGSIDMNPLISELREKQTPNAIQRGICAGFYGFPPNLDINQDYLTLLKKLAEENPDIGNDLISSYGDDQGIFAYFLHWFANKNPDATFFTLSNERHPFVVNRRYSNNRYWISRHIDYSDVEFVHICDAKKSWNEVNQSDLKLLNRTLKEISNSRNKLPTFKYTIDRFILSHVASTMIVGDIHFKSLALTSKMFRFIRSRIERYIHMIPVLKKVFDRITGEKERGNHECGLYMDVWNADNQFLFSYSIDVKNGSFAFNPRLHNQDALTIYFRNYDKVLKKCNFSQPSSLPTAYCKF